MIFKLVPVGTKQSLGWQQPKVQNCSFLQLTASTWGFKNETFKSAHNAALTVLMKKKPGHNDKILIYLMCFKFLLRWLILPLSDKN